MRHAQQRHVLVEAHRVGVGCRVGVDIIRELLRRPFDQRHVGVRRVVLVFHPRRRGHLACCQPVRHRRIHIHFAQHGAQLRQRDAAGPQQPWPRARQRDDRRFHPDAAVAAVHNRVNPPVHVRAHMRGAGGAGLARPVAGRRGQRNAGGVDDCARNRMLRKPHRHGGQSGADFVGNPVAFRQDDRQWPRPIGCRQLLRTGRKFCHQCLNLVNCRDVDDQRIVHRAAFCGEDFGHRRAVECVRRQPVHRLGRDPDQSARPQQRTRPPDSGRVGG